ncbi:MAG: DUF177 domain-containing protein [Deltaproteobacteria bacterium]|nr:DUF177 domain-containing protein [Deltaproteobacteria bacterium]
MNLKVKVADIPAEGQNLVREVFPLEIEGLLNGPEKEAMTLVTPIMVRVKLERTGQRVVVKGPVSTTFRLVCSRCLAEFEQPIADILYMVFSPRNQAVETDDGMGSMNEEYYNGEEIDIWPILKENLILSLPLKPVCRGDCRGLCTQCGLNLNTGECGCLVSTGHPGMAKLKQFKGKLREMDS